MSTQWERIAEPMPVTDTLAAPRPDAIATRDILGIPVALTDYDEVMDVMDGVVTSRRRLWVSAAPVHAIMVAQSDPETRDALRRGLTVPDGMPLVWAVRALGEELAYRVYGPELMWRYCARCVERGHRVWLYGGRDQGSLAQLALNLRRAHPGINIVGGWSPPFRSLSADEESWLAERVARDRPDVLWVGIGVSKQEKWMARMSEKLDVPVMVGVGAAFDFHAGRVSQAPKWMQDRGLEWIYRAAQEPRRLLPRYLRYNPLFVVWFMRQLAIERLSGRSRS